MSHSPHDAPPPPPPPPAAQAVPAGLGHRLAARVLDAVLVGLALSAVVALAGLPAPTWGLGGIEAWGRSAVTLGVWFAYYALAEAATGTTVGKRLVGVRVVDRRGQTPPLRLTAARSAWLLLGLVPIVGGVLQLAAVVVLIVTIARDSDSRGYHDLRTGTRVVRADP